MVLVAIVGALGEGKTLTLAYMAWNNYVFKKREIYSNITLYKIPFYKVRTIAHLNQMIPENVKFEEKLNPKEKFFAGDELWKWVDSQTIGKGAREKKHIIDRILLASRKRHVTIAYTTQSLHQVGKRIRDVTDLIFYPQLSVDNSYCRVLVFNGPKPNMGSMQKPFYFNTAPVMAMYDTFENPTDIEWGDENSKLEKEFHHIWENPAWIYHLMHDAGMSKTEAIKYSKELEKKMDF